MKHINKILQSIVLVLAIMSCTKLNTQLDQGITFTSTISDIQTRSLDFNINDEIGIIADVMIAEQSTTPFFYNEKFVKTINGFTSSNVFFEKEDNQYSFYTYYPYNSKANITSDKIITHSISTAQNENLNLQNSDLLLAKAENIRNTGEPIHLEFCHVLTMLDITINLTTPISSELVCWVKETPTTCKIDMKDNSIISTDTVSDIYTKIGINKSPSSIFASAIVIPQTLELGWSLIGIELDEQIYEFKLPHAVSFEAGHRYSIVINLDNTVTRNATEYIISKISVI